MKIVLPIVELDATCIFFDDREAIKKHEEEEEMLFDTWRTFLKSSHIIENGFYFFSGNRGIVTITKGIEDSEKIRVSSFIRLSDGRLDAILHHEYGKNEIDDLIIDHLYTHSKGCNIFEIYTS